MTNNATTQRDRDNLIEALRECLSPEAISYIHAALQRQIKRDEPRIENGTTTLANADACVEARWFLEDILEDILDPIA